MTEAAIGRIAHRVLADLLISGQSGLSARELIAVVGGHPAVQAETGQLGGARQLILVMAAVYLELFDPRPQWELVGSEVVAPGCRFDLLWRRGDEWRADELKSGRLASPLARRDLDAQLTRQLRGGHKRFGTRFSGVRVIAFGAPRAGFIARPGGEREALGFGGLE